LLPSTTMFAQKKCPECGAIIPAGSRDGLCTQCLFSLGLEPRETPAPALISQDLTPLLAKTTPALGVKLHHFGDYELLEEIARGGMGVVFRARQVSLNRVVALKLIAAGRLASDEAVKRFQLEAEAAARLDHPNIVPVYEVGEHEGQHFFSMKLVEGGSLAEQARASLGERVALLSQVARAVHYAHQRGILHRDLKPGNILVDAKGEPNVTDFGMAKLMEEESSLTHSGVVMGTPGYMSPEQAAGKNAELTTASDVWSLGAILYELVGGQPPFRGNSPMETLRQVMEREPKRVSALNRAVDVDLETCTLRCLEKDPARRYTSAAALADDLDRWLRHEPILARRTGVFARMTKWARRQPVLATAAVLLISVVAAGLSGIVWQWHRADEAQRNTTRANQELRRALSQMDSIQLQRAEEFMAEERRLDALPRWALVLRNDPSNRLAAERLMSTLAHRNWARLACPPLEHSNRVTFAFFSADGKRVVTSSADNTAWVWNASTGQHVAGPLAHSAEINNAVLNPDCR
jgi:hypothetical protein